MEFPIFLRVESFIGILFRLEKYRQWCFGVLVIQRLTDTLFIYFQLQGLSGPSTLALKK